MKATGIIALSLTLGLTLECRLMAHEDLNARLLALTEQISTNQNNVALLIERADLYRLHGNWAAARSDCAAAGKLTPNSVPLLFNWGLLNMDLGDNPAARTALDKVVALDPTNGLAWITRGRVLARQEERKLAIADYSRGLALLANPLPEEFLERASLQAAESDFGQAVQGLDEGMARLGWMMTFQKAAIDYELKRQRPELALARLETILVRANRKETWLAWKGEILQASGKAREAREAYSASLKAIDALPPRMHASATMVQLRAKVEFALTSHADGVTNHKPASER